MTTGPSCLGIIINDGQMFRKAALHLSQIRYLYHLDQSLVRKLESTLQIRIGSVSDSACAIIGEIGSNVKKSLMQWAQFVEMKQP